GPVSGFGHRSTFQGRLDETQHVDRSLGSGAHATELVLQLLAEHDGFTRRVDLDVVPCDHLPRRDRAHDLRTEGQSERERTALQGAAGRRELAEDRVSALAVQRVTWGDGLLRRGHHIAAETGGMPCGLTAENGR